MAISRSDMERQLRAGGGIMTLEEPRQGYFLGKIVKKAKKAVKTKGGTYVKYEKKSASAKSFRRTFKTKCSGGASSFTWQGRSYSCAKASDKKASAPKKSSPIKSRVVNRKSTVRVSNKVPASVMKDLKKKA